MVEVTPSAPAPPALHPDPRCEFLILMASFVLRTLNRLRVAFKGGLDGAMVLLELLAAERVGRLAPAVADDRAPGRRSVTGLGSAIGVPRETVRRLLAGLAAAGWIEAAGSGAPVISTPVREQFALWEGGASFNEFVWVASQVQAAHAARGEAVEPLLTRHPWHLALASQWRAPAEHQFPRPARVLLERLRRAGAEERERLAQPVDAFLCRHLKRLRRTFDGDLILPLLIGEIAQRNVSALARFGGPAGPLHRFAADPHFQAGDMLADYLRCNAYSLSLATGVPEATVRRKVTQLAARGWVRIAPDRALAVDAVQVRARSGAMDAETLADLLKTYATLCTEAVPLPEPSAVMNRHLNFRAAGQG